MLVNKNTVDYCLFVSSQCITYVSKLLIKNGLLNAEINMN